MTQAATFGEGPDGGDGRVRRYVGYGLIALALLAIAWFIYRQATAVQGVRVEAPPPVAVDMLPPPPPPPPPPPQPVVKPPEQPSPETPTPNPQPAKPLDAPAPMQINAPAQAGADSFGLAAGSGSGRGSPGSGGTCLGDNCGTGTGGGGGISEGFYRRYLSDALQQRVQGDDHVNRLVFTADFSITVAGGRVTAVQLLRSSGKDDRDQQLIRILESARGLDPPPASFRFPQKITVRGRRAL